MRKRSIFDWTACVLVVFAAFVPLAYGQSLISELKSEHDPGKRSEKALDLADEAFEKARTSYNSGNVHSGDAELDDMTAALKECADSLDSAHKARYYKKAELKLAFLQRRMQDLLGDLGVQERGWADYTNRKLDEIHERVLNGVMRK